MRTRLLLACVSLFLAACTSSHTLLRDGRAPKLAQDAQVFVALPADGRYETISYAASGAMTLDAVMAAFKKHVVHVEGGTFVATQDEALKAARRSSCSLLVVPEILHWEDRNTEWSGKRDVLEVRLIVVDAETGATLDMVTLGAKSKWATFGGDHPQDLLARSIGTYVDSLF